MKKVLLIFAIIIATCKLNAQDLHFTQFYMTPVLLNPANAGAEYDLRGLINYRSQWKSVTAPFVSTAAAFDMRLTEASPRKKKGFWAAGIYLYNDKSGDSKFTENKGSLNAAYHLYLNENMTLGAGFQAGYIQRSINMSGLQWGSQYNGLIYDANLPSMEANNGKLTQGGLDFGSGLNWTYKKNERYSTGNNQMLINAGIGFQHISKPDVSYQNYINDELFYRWIGHVTGFIGIPNSNYTVAPGILFMKQGPNTELMFGSNFIYKFKESSKYTGNLKGGSFGLGAFFRNKDAIALTALLEIANYTIGFSYDYNTSKLSDYSNGNGGFEISFRYVHPSPFGGVTKSKSRFR
ncbi:MAG TPA: hypothetical protein DIU39_09360 [Flavobacteriales bacterium]|nr:hypothetical protein [Flavobacteriales bacterium]|tara:strand:+ start:35335 stop:36384 length:1050 start_codon:yes stop_codon:yes gene_type:complete